MKCKIISGDIGDIESNINNWLSKNSNIQIKFITQSKFKDVGRDFILISIFYE